MNKKIYECKPCLQFFHGRTDYDYHMSAHKRTAPPVPRVRPPKRPKVMHTDDESML